MGYYTATFKKHPNNFYNKIFQKILVDFSFYFLYDNFMFKKKMVLAYHDILNALENPAQIRCARNKVVVSNKKGAALFGNAEDPFLFLRHTNEEEKLKLLDNAFLQKSHFSLDIPVQNKVWQIRLTPIKKMMLMEAEAEPIQIVANQASQAQIALFQNIIQNLNIPVYLSDIAGEIIYINTSFSALIGYTPSEVLGQNIATFVDSPNLKTNTFLETEIEINSVSGPCFFLLQQHQFYLGQSPVFFGALMPVLRPQLSMSSNSLPFPYLKIAADSLSVLQANDLFLKAFHLECAPTLLSEIYSEQDLQPLINKLTKSHNQLNSEKPIEIASKTGEIFHLYLDWATPDRALAHLYFIDITPSKRLETQVIQAHKMQAIGQLTGGIAHDFNNILTAIMGFTDLLLQQHPVGDASFADLMHIKGNVQKAAGLVGQLLTFSRKTPIQEHTLSVHDAFVDLTSLLQRAIAPKCHLKMEYKRHLGYIKMDTNQLTQIFLNFAVNAKDAMPNGGDLTISLTKEDVKKARPCGNDTMPAGAYVKITITDNGLGISSDVLPHIFDPFFTTKKKSNQSGTGLGLSTVYGIIHSAGGFIKVTSVPNVGTTFTVYLPRFESGDLQPHTPPQNIQSVFLPQAKAPILLVDDEEAIRMVTARALAAKGFDVVQAGSAEEALTHLQATSFQLLITDMVMTGMDGEHLIDEAKKMHPNLPCLLMSGYSKSFEKHTAQQSAKYDFITKPFVLADLLQKVKEILEKN